jgi:hypothetical protein
MTKARQVNLFKETSNRASRLNSPPLHRVHRLKAAMPLVISERRLSRVQAQIVEQVEEIATPQEVLLALGFINCCEAKRIWKRSPNRCWACS